MANFQIKNPTNTGGINFVSLQTNGAGTSASPFTLLANGGGNTNYYSLISAATTNATSVKASPGVIYRIELYNGNAAIRYLKFFDMATAPTVGTSTPVWRMACPGASAGAGIISAEMNGIQFQTGIAFCMVTGQGDSNTTAVAAGDLIVNFTYI